VLIRWSIQHGFVALPRSTNRAHLVENAAVLDFALDDAQMAALDALDEGLTRDWDPATEARPDEVAPASRRQTVSVGRAVGRVNALPALSV
jgi:diketogulonate reductase-like aldo/keto reductase